MVDQDDPAFLNPTKPIGAFYSKEQADNLAAETGDIYREDANRGYRKVVASPMPMDFVEKRSIGRLMNAGIVTIAAGGGGVPVVFSDGEYKDVDAVVDKDFAAEKLAELLDCDTLLILTAVDEAYLSYSTPEQTPIRKASVKEMKYHIENNEFAPGSMLPKVEAACMFASSGKHRRSIIGSLDKAILSFEEKQGTKIRY